VLNPVLLGTLLVVGATVAGLGLAALLSPKADRGPTAREPAAPPRATWSSGLARTRGSLAQRLLSAWRDSGDAETWIASAEEVLLSADVGLKATQQLVARWRQGLAGVSDEAEFRRMVIGGVRDALASETVPSTPDEGPHVVMVVGVNGVGKTTTIGKLARRRIAAGGKVLLVAADTFRAAAIEQLGQWAERTGADLIKHQHGADPSAVTFDGMKAAKARAADLVIVDTAGRLHVKANLMEEVKKMARTAGREIEGAPHEVLLVIDATTGQNALNQAKVFDEALGVSGVVLTKLDGTAKGGVALAIRAELGLPIRYVGLGEGADDLAEFDPQAFAEALFPAAEVEPEASRS